MECAEVFHARAREIEQLILRGENEKEILKGTELSKFRTQELRSFIELTRGAIELGSRRLTAAQYEQHVACGHECRAL